MVDDTVIINMLIKASSDLPEVLKANSIALQEFNAQAKASIMNSGSASAFAGVDRTVIKKAAEDTKAASVSLTEANAAARTAGGGLTFFNTATLATSGNLMLLGAALTGYAIKSFADFQKQLADMQGNTGMTAEQVDVVKNHILDLGRQGPVALDDLVTAARHVNDEGYRGAAAAQVLDAAWKGAIATGGQVADVANTLSREMHNFGEASSQASQTMGVLLVGAQQGNQTLEQEVMSLSKVGPLAASVKMPLTDVVSLVSEFTKATGNPAMSQTWATNMITHMVAPTKQAITVMKELKDATGIDLTDAFNKFSQGQMSFLDVMKLVKEATGANAKEVMTLFGGIRGGVGALQFLTAGMDQYQAIQAKTTDGTKQLNEQFKQQQDTLTNKVLTGLNYVKEGFIGVGALLNDQLDVWGNGIAAVSYQASLLGGSTDKVSAAGENLAQKIADLKSHYDTLTTVQLDELRYLESEQKGHHEAAQKVDEHANAIARLNRALQDQAAYSNGGGYVAPSVGIPTDPGTASAYAKSVQSNFDQDAAVLNFDKIAGRAASVIAQDTEAYKNSLASLEKWDQGMQELQAPLSSFKTGLKSATDASTAISDSQKRLKEAQDQAALDTVAYGHVLPEHQHELESATTQARLLSDALAKVTTAAKGWGDWLTGQQSGLQKTLNDAVAKFVYDSSHGASASVLGVDQSHIQQAQDKLDGFSTKVDLATGKTDAWTQRLDTASKAATAAQHAYLDDLNTLGPHARATEEARRTMLAANTALKYLQDEANSAAGKLKAIPGTTTVNGVKSGPVIQVVSSPALQNTETSPKQQQYGSLAAPASVAKTSGAELTPSQNKAWVDFFSITSQITQAQKTYDDDLALVAQKMWDLSHHVADNLPPLSQLEANARTAKDALDGLTKATNDAKNALTPKPQDHPYTSTYNPSVDSVGMPAHGPVDSTSAGISADVFLGNFSKATQEATDAFTAGTISQKTYNDYLGQIATGTEQYDAKLGNLSGAADVAKQAYLDGTGSFETYIGYQKQANAQQDSNNGKMIAADVALGDFTGAAALAKTAYENGTMSLQDYVAIQKQADAATAARTQKDWDAAFAAGDLATKSSMLSQLFGGLVSRASTIAGAQSSVDNARLGVIAANSDVQVGLLQSLVTETQDLSSIASAHQGVQTAIFTGELAKINDGVNLMQVIASGQQAQQATLQAIQQDAQKGDAQKLGLDQRLLAAQQQAGRDAVTVATLQMEADQANARMQLKVAQDGEKMAIDKLAVDRVNDANAAKLSLDKLAVAKDTYNSSVAQQKLTLDTMPILAEIAANTSPDGTTVNDYGQMIKNDLLGIQGLQTQASADQTAQAKDQAGANQDSASGNLLLGNDQSQTNADSNAALQTQQLGELEIAKAKAKEAGDNLLVQALQAAIQATTANTAAVSGNTDQVVASQQALIKTLQGLLKQQNLPLYRKSGSGGSTLRNAFGQTGASAAVNR